MKCEKHLNYTRRILQILIWHSESTVLSFYFSIIYIYKATAAILVTEKEDGKLLHDIPYIISLSFLCKSDLWNTGKGPQCKQNPRYVYKCKRTLNGTSVEQVRNLGTNF